MQGLTNAGVSGLRVYCSPEAPNTTHDNDIWIVTDLPIKKVKFTDYHSYRTNSSLFREVGVAYIIQKINAYPDYKFYNNTAIPFDKNNRMIFWPYMVSTYLTSGFTNLRAFAMKSGKWIAIALLSLPIYSNGKKQYIESIEATDGGTYKETGSTLVWTLSNYGHGSTQYLNIRIKAPFDFGAFTILRIDSVIKGTSAHRACTVNIVDPESSNVIASGLLTIRDDLVGSSQTMIQIRNAIDMPEFIIKFGPTSATEVEISSIVFS